MSLPNTRPAVSQPLDYPVPVNKASRKSSASQRNTWNINSPLPWFCFACLLAGGAVGGMLMQQSMMPQLIDAKVAAGIAAEHAATAEQFAKQKVEIEAVTDSARISTNHWRNIETDVAVLEKQMTLVQQEIQNARSRKR